MLLGAILLIGIGLLLVLLAVPVRLTFSVERRAGQSRVDGTVRWLFGLVRVRLGGGPARRVAAPQSARPRRRARRRIRRVAVAARTPGFAARVVELGRTLVRRIRVEALTLRVRVGLGDPADTGCLWGVVGPVVAMVRLPALSRAVFEPAFEDAVLEVAGAGRIRVVPLAAVASVLAFLLSPVTLRALLASRASTR